MKKIFTIGFSLLSLILFSCKSNKVEDYNYENDNYGAETVIEHPEITVPKEDLHSFIVKGKIPSDTINAIKNCKTLEFILNDKTDVSPQISISFEGRILTNIKRFM